MADDLFRILLVDDDEVDAGFVMRAFQDFRERVMIDHVDEADAAIEALADRHFDVVILDINLNGANGLEMIQPIRALKKSPYIPIIMFTSSSSADDIRRAYANGANAYVEKPLSIQGYRQFAAKFLGFWAETALVPAS